MHITRDNIAESKGLLTTFNDQLKRSNAYIKHGSDNNVTFIKVNCLHPIRQPSTVKLLEVLHSSKDNKSIRISRLTNGTPHEAILTRKFLEEFNNKEFYPRLPENDKKNILRTMRELKKVTNSNQFDKILAVEFPIMPDTGKLIKTA